MIKIFQTGPATRVNISLACAAGFLLGVAFPPFPLGALAYVGFVPLFFLLNRLETTARQFTYLYLSFFVMSAIALYWVGGFTHLKDPYLMMAGGLLLIWQPVYFSFAMLVFVFVRNRLGVHRGMLAFPFLWVTIEWLYAYSELSFPWLTLGNTQTYFLDTIQFIELTGVYGLSFWILVLNVVAYYIIGGIRAAGVTRSSTLLGTVFAVLLVLPNAYSYLTGASHAPESGSSSVTVGVVQPNIDPWDKWEGAATFAGRWKQTLHYLDLVGTLRADSVDIAVLPESAILFDIPTVGDYAYQVRTILDSLHMGLVSGYMGMHIYTAGTEPPSSSAFRGTDVHYDAFNAVMYMQPRVSLIQTYNKMRLVPFAERIPYADQVPFLIAPLRWGVGISNWGLGRDSTVFSDARSGTKFLAMVCYESIFPEYVASYVKRGAEYLVFITNDSWWGNTSGARQHNRYAVLRAVENRRWAVRCANGGISSFIDPSGAIYDETSMYTEASIVRRIEARRGLTFYAQHGDWLGRICGAASAVWVLLALVRMFQMKQRNQ